MDRQAALDQLELIRPDADEFHEPDFAEAVAYLETDESAKEIFLRRQGQDRQIAAAMVDVRVPEGLGERLRESLSEDPPNHPARIANTPARRRWLISAVTVVASCLVALLGIWWFHDPEPKLLALPELEMEVPFDSEEIGKLQAFQGEFEPSLPDRLLWTSSQRFTFSSPKGFASNRAGSDRVAVYEFTFHDPRNPRLGEKRGVMLVVPKSLVEAAPSGETFFASAYKTVRSKPNVAIRSWSEGELVYISMTAIRDDEALGSVLDPPTTT